MTHTPHAFGISDIMSCLAYTLPGRPADTQTVRIDGFYQITTTPSGISCLVPCHLDHPDLCVVSSVGVSGQMHDPWNLAWERPVPWAADMVRNERALHDERVNKGFNPLTGINSTNYPGIFARHKPLTHHTRLRVRAWVQECQRRAQAWRPQGDTP